jgi:thiosulfate/3-mercaptopyruvate sulfurtransferase
LNLPCLTPRACGGISAAMDLFLLHRLGYDNLSLYDGSMGEWAKDASLPIETG